MKSIDIIKEEEFIEEFRKQFEYSKSTHKTFQEMVEPIISHTNTEIFCEKTELSPATFSRFKNPHYIELGFYNLMHTMVFRYCNNKYILR